MLEVCRIVAAWLEDVTTGVNALLPSVPRNGADTQPANVTVFDEATDALVAAGRLPDTFPALVVHVTAVRWAEEQQVAGPVRDGEADVLIRYQVQDVETAAAQADSSYTLRAVERCLRRNAFNVQTTMNGVTVYQMIRLERARIDGQMEDTIVTAGVLATFRLRDGAPT
jgi:hypothetical protein